MTAGTDGNTLDGMSMARVNRIIASLKNHSYQPQPAKRKYIAKKNSGKKRPLGIPSTDAGVKFPWSCAASRLIYAHEKTAPQWCGRPYIQISP